jgi:hypothetical protein
MKKLIGIVFGVWILLWTWFFISDVFFNKPELTVPNDIKPREFEWDFLNDCCDCDPLGGVEGICNDKAYSACFEFCSDKG